MSRGTVIRLRPAPHAGQRKLAGLQAGHRFVAAPCGRRFGKTLYLLQDAFRQAVNRPGARVWWVDPIQYLARRAFRLILPVVQSTKLDQEVSRTELRIELVNGSVMEFHSAERGDKMRGEGIHVLAINEASLIKKQVWDEVLYPALTDTGGGAAFAFTPKGKGHWTHEWFQRGLSPEHPEVASIQLPSTANPYIKPELIEAARRDLPEATFRQEYLAEFLDDGSGVFQGVRECIAGELDRPGIVPQAGPYVGGLDLAKHQDWTVLQILDCRGRLAWHERMQRQSWPTMKGRIIEACRRYRPRLLVERNHVGDVVIDDLRQGGVEVEAFVTTGQSKAQLIQGLMLAIERGLISFPEVPELITELEIFEFQRLPSGHVRYAAPEGAHDDEVMALALAARAYLDSHKQRRRTHLAGVEIDSLIVREAA